MKLQVYHVTNNCRKSSIYEALYRKCWYDFTFFGLGPLLVRFPALKRLTRTAAERSGSKASNLFNGDIWVCGWWANIWSNSHGTIVGPFKRLSY